MVPWPDVAAGDPMSLSNVTATLTARERQAEPRFLHIVAWYDGWSQAHGADPSPMPRRLTRSEAKSWREGHAEGVRERRCHAAHGFTPCREELHP